MYNSRALTKGWMQRQDFPAATLSSSGVMAPDSEQKVQPMAGFAYYPDDGAIACRNGTRRMNRPLYCNQETAAVFAGEMPEVCGPLGIMQAGIIRDDIQIGFGHFSQRLARYRSGQMDWELSDARLPGLTVFFTVTTSAEGNGFVARISATGTIDGDELAWCLLPPGTFTDDGDPQLLENAPTRLIAQGPDAFLGTHSGPSATPSSWEWHGWKAFRLEGRISAPTDAWRPLSVQALRDHHENGDFARMLAVKPGEEESAGLYARVPLEAASPQFLAVSANVAPGDPAAAFAAGLARAEGLQQRILVDTPDASLNAGVSASVAAVYGVYVPSFFFHAGTVWRAFYLGWRVRGGATAYGWHDLVRAAVSYALENQVEDSPYVGKEANSFGTIAAFDSRFYGSGYISVGQFMYNMQSQLFDEAVRDWLATGNDDSDYCDKLLKGLELHLAWQKDCFDPDGDGLYESCINSWATDSVWYNGGGSVEESVYAYTARRAAAQMRRLRGDEEAAAAHEAEAERIHSALNRALWLPRKGHYAAYIEQGGHQRVHEDAWVLSQYLPVEAGLTTPQQAWQALYYTDWAMEKHRLPGGGEIRQTSNWVPGHWSVREWYGGDNFGMALSYFLAGQGDEGWELLQGAMRESMYGDLNEDRKGKTFAINIKAPGGLNKSNGGIDFTDVTTMFTRAVVEGLFGYNPNYPAGEVLFTPAFPADWEHASIRTPDFSIAYRREGDVDRYEIELTRPAKMLLRLPVRAEKVKELLVNGKAGQLRLEPWAGCAMLRIETEARSELVVSISMEERRARVAPIRLSSNPGCEVEVRSGFGPVKSVLDPQGCLEGASVSDGVIRGQAGGAPGHRLLFAGIEGDVPLYQLVQLEVTDQATDDLLTANILREAPADAKWEPVAMSEQWNGAVQEIFKQDYRSPRPETISCRIGYDGWSAWTFPFWKYQTPTPALDQLDALVQADGLLTSPQGGRFTAPEETRNIAFTSLWDNWPSTVTVPVGQSGRAVWLLVSGSTNPMQGHIPNAVLTFKYADKTEEKLELIPPMNFWSLAPYGALSKCGTTDYDYSEDGFSLPDEPPAQVQLGANCRAMVYGWKLRPGVALESISLEALSQEVVIGIMAVSIMK